MFGRRVIRLGDPTTHGGVVVSASGRTVIFGKPVARVGDKVTCPRPGHGVVAIVEGDKYWTEDGKPVALEGHKCSCGCSLISTLPNVVRSYEGDGVASATRVSDAALTATAVGSDSVGQDDEPGSYDEQARLTSPPIYGVPYFIEISDGRTFSGRVDDSNLLPRVDTADEDEYVVYWGD